MNDVIKQAFCTRMVFEKLGFDTETAIKIGVGPARLPTHRVDLVTGAPTGVVGYEDIPVAAFVLLMAQGKTLTIIAGALDMSFEEASREVMTATVEYNALSQEERKAMFATWLEAGEATGIVGAMLAKGINPPRAGALS